MRRRTGAAHRTAEGRGSDVDEQRVTVLAVRVRQGAGDDAADAEDIERAARALRAELLETDVEDVRPAAAPAPRGAKPGDPTTWETLLVTLAASGGVLATLITAVSAWLSRQHPDTTVELEIGGDRITLPDATAAERSRLIQLLADRHADGAS
ncbi:effector-associated constant component EACC1 [Actinacidiphila alni]|uniref:effector-associated constant component EACC1 n=1 Tax=Actinacidiphila alni TaxID=380248 RepID=UPI003456A56C